MKVLYGMHPADAGTITVAGREVRITRPTEAMRLGLGMVHQHFMLVDTLTVAENVVLGREPHGPLGAFAPRRSERLVRELAERFRLPVDPHARVEHAVRRRAAARRDPQGAPPRARVLILDEPTAVLTPQEVDELFAVLRTLREAGTTIVLITHKLAEVKALADRVTVMRAGRVVGGGAVADFSIDALAELMVGRVPAPLGARADRAPGAACLEARHLSVRSSRGLRVVHDVSLAVRAGEIVGLAGVEGNGQHEFIERLAGLRARGAGHGVDRRHRT
jgi:simple sugar transport system ATP-binding protein